MAKEEKESKAEKAREKKDPMAEMREKMMGRKKSRKASRGGKR